MTTPEPNTPPVETDSRFPSGPWTGFFLQPDQPRRRHDMELVLTFRDGAIRGEGRDRVGRFLIVGRYDLNDGKCWWTKRYIGQHDLFYKGFNEGKGIWGVWEDPRATFWRGGFHIWPEAMGDPYALRAVEEAETPAQVVDAPQPVLAGTAADPTSDLMQTACP